MLCVGVIYGIVYIVVMHGMCAMFVMLSNFPESYTHYKIWVKAFTFKNEGQSSEPIEVLTDVTGPDAPTLRNMSCVNDITLSVEWALPISYDRSVDYFILQYRIQPPASSEAAERGRYIIDIVTRPFHEIIIGMFH
jgi:hypothetical protein